MLIALIAGLIAIMLVFFISYKFIAQQQQQARYQLTHDLRDRHDQLRQALHQQLADLQTTLNKHQIEQLQQSTQHIQQGFKAAQEQINLALDTQNKRLAERIDQLTQKTDQRLELIANQVDKRLSDGFEKTTATFTDIIKRLALIDEAQKRITELSANVVSLQDVLSNKQARGAFGEVQLSSLIHDLIPANHANMQHTLSNGKRADCLLNLPEPTGNIVIDAKFPLDAYRRIHADDTSPEQRKLAQQQFIRDIKKHISDIASKYIIPGETTDGAIMFIPAEAIFAEVHSQYPELVSIAQQARVWMVSPTTMMAIITTARAVIKDDATRKQVHIIQEHLRKLSKNFDLFRGRMDKLAQHIKQAHDDVGQIHTSAHKITRQFEKIEQVELQQPAKELLD